MVAGLQEAVQAATNSAGQIDYPMLQRMMGLSNEEMDNMTASGAFNEGSGGTLSFYNPDNLGASSPQPIMPAPSGGGSTPIAGQSDAWLSPGEMRDRLNSLNGSMSSGGSGGGGGGGGGGGSAPAGSGGVLSGISSGANTGQTNTSPNFAPLQQQGTAPINYQSPQGLNGAYTGGQFGGPTSAPNGGQGVLNMQQPNSQNAIAAYQNTPGYQMLGNDQTNQYQQSPGYQYAVSEALNQVQQGAASRGLLESGSALRAMTDRAQGMAQQDYGNWWNRQNQLYGDYQNRLQGLAGGSTGGDQAMQLGQGLGASSLQTGSNLAGLFGNQGNSGLGAYTNTGAAQANTMQQAANTQLQVGSANNSTLLAGAMLNKGSF